jgi:hypothetical protein
MNRTFERRLARLEANAPDPTIPIFVEDEADVGRRVDELIAERKLSDADRPRCVHWTRHQPRKPMTHEDWVDVLDALEADNERRGVRTRREDFESEDLKREDLKRGDLEREDLEREDLEREDSEREDLGDA